MGSPSPPTRFIDSFGSSLVGATRCWVTLLNPRGKFLIDRLSNQCDRNPVEDLPEKPLNQHPLGHGVRDAPALEIKEVLGVHRTDGRAMTAAQDVLVEDLQAWLRGSLRVRPQQQVALGLI